MTIVRIAVAKLELTSFTPILARIAVNAAKKAERNAYKSHTNYYSKRKIKNNKFQILEKQSNLEFDYNFEFKF